MLVFNVSILSRLQDVVLEFLFDLDLELLDLAFVFSLSLLDDRLEVFFLELSGSIKSLLLLVVNFEGFLSIIDVLLEIGFLVEQLLDSFGFSLTSFSFDVIGLGQGLLVLVFLLFLKSGLDILLEFDQSLDVNGSKIFFGHVFNLDTFDFGDLETFNLDDFGTKFHLLLEVLDFHLFSELLFFDLSVVFFDLTQSFLFFVELVLVFLIIFLLVQRLLFLDSVTKNFVVSNSKNFLGAFHELDSALIEFGLFGSVIGRLFKEKISSD